MSSLSTPTRVIGLPLRSARVTRPPSLRQSWQRWRLRLRRVQCLARQPLHRVEHHWQRPSHHAQSRCLPFQRWTVTRPQRAELAPARWLKHNSRA